MSLAGERIQIDQTDGRGKIYGFFAHWCPFCQDEVSALADYFEQNQLPETVDFYAVCTSADPSRDNFPPVDWFERENWPFPVLEDTDDSDIAAGFGLPSFPYLVVVVVGGDGTAVQRLSGRLSDEAAISDLIDIAEANAANTKGIGEVINMKHNDSDIPPNLSSLHF